MTDNIQSTSGDIINKIKPKAAKIIRIGILSLLTLTTQANTSIAIANAKEIVLVNTTKIEKTIVEIHAQSNEPVVGSIGLLGSIGLAFATQIVKIIGNIIEMKIPSISTKNKDIDNFFILFKCVQDNSLFITYFQTLFFN
ncbi:MAG: hypothetical protein RR201_00405 [Malacoplasma sp.]